MRYLVAIPRSFPGWAGPAGYSGTINYRSGWVDMSDEHEIDRAVVGGAIIPQRTPGTDERSGAKRDVVPQGTGAASSMSLRAAPFGDHWFGQDEYPHLDSGYVSETSSTATTAAKDGALYGAVFVVLYLLVTHGQWGIPSMALWAVGGIAGGAAVGAALYLGGRLLGWILEIAAWVLAALAIVFMWVTFH